MKTLLTLIFLFLSLGLVVAQTAVQSTSFEKKTFQMGTDQMPYAILLPDDLTLLSPIHYCFFCMVLGKGVQTMKVN